jgi:hypothetical protein
MQFSKAGTFEATIASILLLIPRRWGFHVGQQSGKGSARDTINAYSI